MRKEWLGSKEMKKVGNHLSQNFSLRRISVPSKRDWMWRWGIYFFGADNINIVNDALGNLRKEVARRRKLISKIHISLFGYQISPYGVLSI